MDATLWQRCIRRLEGELSEQQLNTWIRPLQAVEEPQLLRLYAPNRFVVDWISEHYLDRLNALACEFRPQDPPRVALEIGSSTLPACGRIFGTSLGATSSRLALFKPVTSTLVPAGKGLLLMSFNCRRNTLAEPEDTAASAGIGFLRSSGVVEPFR